MNDQISALVDGELGEEQAARLLGRLKSEPELRRAWDEYHRVGDALRGHLAPDIAAAVSARLASEPTVLSPRRSSAPSPLSRWVLPAAASLAAVALVAWMSLPMRPDFEQLAAGPGATPQKTEPLASDAQVASLRRNATANVPAGAQLLVRGSTRQPVPLAADSQAEARAQAQALAALGMGNYLLAHQRYSPSNALQGAAPYVRIVSYGDDQ